MLELSTFFDGMPKQLLRHAHERAYGKKGLLNNALIQLEVMRHFGDRERVSAMICRMEPWQRRALNLIYLSGARGLAFNELRLTVPVGKSKELRQFLLEMCREFVIWRSQVSGTSVYLGFCDFLHCFENKSAPVELTSKGNVGYGNLFVWHVCLILSMAYRGELRINAGGTLHRRDFQLCCEALTTCGSMSSAAPENEVSFIFYFLTQNGWLELEDSVLYPSDKAVSFLKGSGFRLRQFILSWWIDMRIRGDNGLLRKLLEGVSSGISVSDAASHFWVIDPTFRLLELNRSLAWDYLPRPLRELWLLGLVNFQVRSGKIEAITLNDDSRAWCKSSVIPTPDESVSSLPNFDVILSTGTSPYLLYSIACLAKVHNDDAFLCFTLAKDAYIEGLKNGFPESEMTQLLEWINPPTNVLLTLREWNSSFYGAKVRTVRLLKIGDATILSELLKFEKFMECTEEYIPGYGFLMRPELENLAFSILETFGFSPFADLRKRNCKPAPCDEWKKDFIVSRSLASKPDYELKDDVDEASLQTSLNSTKYGNVYQKLETFDLVKVLRYAKMSGASLAAKIKDPAKRNDKEREIFFHVHALHLAKSPSSVEIEEQGSEGKRVLLLSFVQEIKVVAAS